MEYKYILILIVIVYLPVLITGQYTLRGVPESYAVLGENYRLQCDVTDSLSVVDFRRNNIVVCNMINCGSQSDNRYKCGCINNNNKQLYLNISNINKQDDTTWSCRGNSGGQGSTTVSVYYGPENTRFNPNSDNIDVIEGKSQSVNCLADCNPDCNITWSKDGSTTILNNPLSLSTRDQTGSYNCTVKHTVLNKQLTKQLNVQIYCRDEAITYISDGPDKLTFSPNVTSINIIEDGPDKLTFSPNVTSINIIEAGPDKITFSPDVTSINIIEDGPDKLTFSSDVSSINIIEGGDQTITCLTDCYECNYKWTGPVSSSTKDLVLTLIKRNQEGNYRCEATNIKNTNPKTRSKSIQVNVHCQYTIIGVPESYAVLGEKYTLQCDVTDSPSSVEFRRNNIAVCNMINCGSSSTDNRYKCGCINNNNKTLYLNISNINKQDDTTWSCRGNSGGQGSTTVTVYYGPAKIRFNPTSDNIDVIEGKTQSVNCLADCKPDCNITWSKDGSTKILNSPLSLSARDQTGSYNCTVKHTVLNKQLTKQLNAQIYYGPDELTFSLDVTRINITEGRNQTIACLTDCYVCNYKWTGPVSSSSKDLVLTGIKRNQEGNYRCEATNIKNTISKTRSKFIQVNVHYQPEITSMTSDAVTDEGDEGSDVMFNCNVNSKPVSTITWSSSTSTDTNIGQQWTLTQAKCQDTGIYTCTANNGIGQSTSKLPLNIRCKSIFSQYTIIYTCTTNNGIGQSTTKLPLNSRSIYTCTTNNGIGQTTTKSLPLSIRCSPRINGDLKDEVMNRLGEEVTLLIDVIAYPKPSFKWIQESTGQELTPDTTQQLAINNYSSSLTVTIQQSSFGNYIVTVNNGIGDDKSYTIKIIDGDPITKADPNEQPGYQEVLGTGIGIGIGISAVIVILVLLTIFIYRKHYPANKKLPNESYATFSNRNPEDGPENIRFNPNSDNIDVIEGKSQSVDCLADCKPDCNITWSKDGSTTILNNPLSLSTRDQTGSYNCTVKHTVLNKQLTKQLNVQIYYGPDKLTFSPDITSVNIIEGRDQTISCLTDCYKCNYKWTGPISSSTKDLVLTQIKRNQEGNYRCEATNIKNTNPKTRPKYIQVNVHYPPYITSITSDAVNNEIDEGSDVIFNCNVDSKPVSTITWSSPTSTDTYTGQQWTLTQAKCQDTGIYTCTANNGIANNGIGQSTTKLPLNIRSNSSIGQSTTKSLPLNIRCSPRINGDLKDEVMNRLGEEVTLLIDVIAYPKPSFKWIQESTGQELTLDTTQQVATNNYISSLTFTIQQSSFDPGTKPISVEETLYKECLGTGIGIGIGISVMCLLLVLLTIFIYRKYHPANKKLPEESYATFSNRIPEDRTYEDLNTRPEVNDNNQHNSGDVKEYENLRGN
ncbi:hypothetical protein LOTGIDRAFT_239376 [Lottia gigantea]|uniref:Ig-like domain-containing protein n=1 Tax=Lottia gigantea TaxID=225164 RepID=V4AGG7_LOTGI|nr:hypothetical protein LOTGIDRAFT_239376 [Lottia gigantea]ESO95972.1 hypothetical protein LOTGIDRAFT_239376 [Lottia gigantea]